MLKIAVIGSGVAGMTAAHYLSDVGEVDLIEASSQIGGHTRAVGVDDPTLGRILVDTGFIVYNDANYPNFIALLAALGVETQPSDMSFSFEAPHLGVVWGSDFPKGVFAKPGSWRSPQHLRFIWGVNQFNKRCLAAYAAGIPSTQTLGQFIQQNRVHDDVVRYYILPMTSAIWSASYADSLDFPMVSFVRFWKNHQLLELGKGHLWRTVTNSAQSYIDRLLPGISGKIITQSPVQTVRSTDTEVTIMMQGRTHVYDAVVIATHADTAYRLIENPTDHHTQTLGQWRYSNNMVTFHTDSTQMPARRSAWCSWNVREPNSGLQYDRPASVTYWMNRLQSIRSSIPYLVTLNPVDPIDPARIISETILTHPVMSQSAMATQSILPELNMQSRVVFAGSYFGYGFHEDAVKSAVNAVAQLRKTLNR